MSDDTWNGSPFDREQLEAETDVEFVKGSGPGGQHRNKRETGVRLVHRPTGIVVTATERRSQPRNLDAAFERLAARLEEHFRPEVPRVPTKVPRAAKRQRLTEKRRRAAVKATRKRPPPDVD